MLPKQRLAGPHGGKLPLSNTTTQSNGAWILSLFIAPDTHFNLVTQLPAVPSPLDLSHYLSFSHSPLISISLDPLLPLACLLPYASFLPRQWHSSPPLLSSPECIVTEIMLLSLCLLTCLSFSYPNGSLFWQGASTGLPASPPGKVWRPGAPCCREPCCLGLPDTYSLAGKPEVSRSETHEREQTPDVATTKPMPKSCSITGIKLGKPLDWSSKSPLSHDADTFLQVHS